MIPQNLVSHNALILSFPETFFWLCLKEFRLFSRSDVMFHFGNIFNVLSLQLSVLVFKNSLVREIFTPARSRKL